MLKSANFKEVIKPILTAGFNSAIIVNNETAMAAISDFASDNEQTLQVETESLQRLIVTQWYSGIEIIINGRFQIKRAVKNAAGMGGFRIELSDFVTVSFIALAA